MSGTLFQLFKSHCIYCKHTESDVESRAANNAMERHYWDEHYNQEDRARLRAAGQASQRMGRKQ